MPTTPPTITALPTPPNRTDPTTFSARADAWVAAVPTFSNQIAAVGTNAFNNATEAQQSATSAASSASAASGSATAAATSASAAATSATTAVNAPGTSGTSTTSLTIGTGSQTFTTQTGKAWVVGQFVTVASTASPTNFMHGQITAYNSGTGSMTVSVLSVGGSGTLASWTIGLGGPNSTLTDQNSLQPVALTLPSIRPSLLLDFANSKKLDPRITFSRATSGTYYDGVTSAKAEENLLAYSQQFENNVYWTKLNTTVTADATTAPDGTATADAIFETATTGSHNVYRNELRALSGTYTTSVFAKANGRNWIAINRNYAGSQYMAYFDLQNGVVGSVAAGFTASIQSAGNGWYRCIVSGPTGNNTYFGGIVYTAESDGSTTVQPSFAGDVTKGVYLWGWQSEQRSVATAYTPTTTQPITNYVPQLLTAPAGAPRFDHNPTTGESLGLLVEEQRTNLLTYSEQFDNAAWDKTRVSVTANASVAPDGTLSADLFVADAANNTHSTYPAAGLTISGTYTWSIYAKAAGSQWFAIDAYTGGGSNLVFFDLQNGVVGQGSGSPTITSVGNGWYRCTVTRATSAGTFFGVYAATANGVTSFAGNGYSGIFIWGAQLEAGAFATSYIPTTSASVTRTADAASMTGVNFSSWFNQSGGTIYGESLSLYGGDDFESSTSGRDSPLAFGDGVENQFEPLVVSNVSVRVRRAAGQFRDKLTGEVVLYEYLDNTYPGNTFIKFSVACRINDYAASVNGQTVQSTSTPRSVIGTRLVIGGNYSQQAFSGCIRRIAYYPARLTNAQLQALTA